jgi:pimeloyl-ACP methyl ester carboxylesterase
MPRSSSLIACAWLALCAALPVGADTPAAIDEHPAVKALFERDTLPPAGRTLDASMRDHERRTRRPLPDVDAHVLALLPYSALARAAYCQPGGTGNAVCAEAKDAEAEGWRYIAEWPTVLEHEHNFEGMVFSVWWRETDEPGRAEIGVAFRGTDFKSPADWRTNLRWFLPGRDQYNVLAEIVPHVIDHAKQHIGRWAAEHRQPGFGRFRIVSTGHSLGGGLAQLFAYKSTEVNAAVVFDSSPVTGFHSCVSDTEVNCHVPVWRVYERGEVLSYLRSFTRQFYPLSENITEIEFDLLGGNPIVNHSMDLFHERLLLHVKAQPTLLFARPADLFAPRLDCTCARVRKAFSWHTMRPACDRLAALREPLAPLAYGEFDPQVLAALLPPPAVAPVVATERHTTERHATALRP